MAITGPPRKRLWALSSTASSNLAPTADPAPDAGSDLYTPARRRARAAESARLEIVWPFAGPQGSNPCASAVGSARRYAGGGHARRGARGPLNRKPSICRADHSFEAFAEPGSSR